MRHLHAIVREALAWAVKHQLLGRNVAEAIDAPTFGRKEMATWTSEEAQRFLIAAEGHRYGPLWLLYLATGMRRGEALGLRWRDLDLDSARVTVAQSVVALNDQVRIQEPKTASSRRAVKLPLSCLVALREHRTRQLEQRLAASAWQDNDLIFCQSDGAPHDPRSVGRAFDVLQRRAGVRRIRLHDLRHTHATLLFNDGHNVKMISQRLGHRDVSITLNVYAHLSQDAQDAAAGAIDRLLGGQAGEDDAAAVN